MGTVNWSDLQKAAGDAGFEPVPAGTYDVIIKSTKATQSTSGKDMIKVTFKVENGPYSGRQLFNQFVISPDSANALAFFFRHMSALGLKDAYFATGPSLEQVAKELENRRARVKVSISQWQGQDRNQVDGVMPPADGVEKGDPGAVSTPTPSLPSPSTPAPAAAPTPTLPAPAATPQVTPAVAPDPTPPAPVMPAPPELPF